MVVRDPAFWREVATAGGLAAVAGSLVVVFGGFADSPFYIYGIVIAISGGLLALAGGILSGYLSRRVPSEEGRDLRNE